MLRAVREDLGRAVGLKSMIVITDGMDMHAIAHRYEAGQAAVNALLAGADMVMAIGSLEETVSVEAAAPLVDVQSAGIGDIVRNERSVELPLQEVFGRGGALKSSWYGDCLPSRDFPLLIDLFQQGRFPLDWFVSERIGLDDVEEAFHRMERGEVLRSVVVL